MLDVMLRRVGPGGFRGEAMNRASFPFIKEMYEVAVGSFEKAAKDRMLIHHAFITSPLKFDYETLDLALAAQEEGIPIRIGASMNVAGASAPGNLCRNACDGACGELRGARDVGPLRRDVGAGDCADSHGPDRPARASTAGRTGRS